MERETVERKAKSRTLLYAVLFVVAFFIGLEPVFFATLAVAFVLFTLLDAARWYWARGQS